MTAIEVRYGMLRKVATEQEIKFADLEVLKDLFSTEIDSVRRLECIRNVADLIDCLERRDIISEYNVAAFYELAEYCSGQALHEALADYAVPKEITSLEPVNQYSEQRLRENVLEQLKINGKFSKPQPKTNAVHNNAKIGGNASSASDLSQATENSERKCVAIYKLLAQELGTYWRRFGRELQVREGAMDDIELQFPRDTTSRVHKLLQIFEEDECHDPKRNIQIIIEALNECQRKDLRRKVEKILAY